MLGQQTGRFKRLFQLTGQTGRFELQPHGRHAPANGGGQGIKPRETGCGIAVVEQPASSAQLRALQQTLALTTGTCLHLRQGQVQVMLSLELTLLKLPLASVRSAFVKLVTASEKVMVTKEVSPMVSELSATTMLALGRTVSTP